MFSKIRTHIVSYDQSIIVITHLRIEISEDDKEKFLIKKAREEAIEAEKLKQLKQEEKKKKIAIKKKSIEER